MPKFRMQCTECENIYTTRKSHTRRHCPYCKITTNFVIVKKKEPITLIREKKTFSIMCLRCRAVGHFQQIPKSCSNCGQKFQQHAENANITDVLYNYFVGGNKEKGYLRVEIGKDGTPWWTPEKDAYGDDVDPFIGDAARTRQTDVYMGQGDLSRTDDLRPVYTTTTVRKKNFRS